MDTGIEIKLSEAAEMVGGKLVGPDATVYGFCSLNVPRTGAIAFVERVGRFKKSVDPMPSGLIVREEIEDLGNAGQIVVENPRLAFVQLMKYFHPPVMVDDDFRHPSAVISEDAAIGEPSYVGPGCVIEPGAVIASECYLSAQVFVGSGAHIGSKCLIHPGVKVMHDVHIGDRCIIGPGTVIGSDGFGFLPRGEEILKVPQVGFVLIGNDVELGANVTIDRATLDATIIGDMTKLDNLVHVGHNVLIGNRVRLAAQVGIAGGVTIGDDVVMGGQAGVAHGVHIGNKVMAGGQAGVTRNVQDGMAVSGYPAREHRHQLQVEAAIHRLPKLMKKLQKQLEEPGDGEDRVKE